ncbi:unnamed protein product [Arabidopsis thaliana]|uniref:Small polypeptide DEVIL 23 n=4 Tax=Arabidopsis TaxID=3701 RepID=DVL23_ARATH|nr:ROTUNDIFOLIA like 13 [Arabidopsis thaliana]A8MRE9.2 RecName: Full=Small polypeptide DEVIL 23; AltName: Full=Small polypeptide ROTUNDIFOLIA LIKE 13; Short=Small polypeptide ROT-FOUR-LIKE 13 [Arabidopsis thaliana]AEE76791.2 ROTUNDIFOLIA like 13 [Arabidopsis thaliana]CAA0383455.1 unnamed protein product [Arabidopsis thaliana]VYS58381.1 unnamed protein product [Arabidopsis thaliana]|eukprot:NP_001319626.1 ROTUNDIFOLIA like 13 [Arabidopsis thaliana]
MKMSERRVGSYRKSTLRCWDWCKEQRTRAYIIWRCLIFLLRWDDY